MGEHDKDMQPPPQGNGRSLFERAESFFGGGSIKPASVPKDLARTPERLRGKPVRRLGQRITPTQDVPPLDLPEEDRDASEPKAPKARPGDSDNNIPERRRSTVPNNAVQVERRGRPQRQKYEFTQEPRKIDRGVLRDHGLIVPDGQVTTLFEEFRIVKRQVLLATRDALRAGGGSSEQRILVCSPLPEEGKTFCAANLALALSTERDVEVVLVDADFAKPSLMTLLGINGRGKGLMDALADPGIRVEDCVLPTDIRGFNVLPAGSQNATDSEFLASTHTIEVLERLTQGAPNRFVIFDSPPALAASPAAELAKHVGQALVIARADQTGQTALEDALTLLSACPDIKLLLNAANFSPSGRRFGTYYGYEE